ncbi:MAG TPA: hypothetical protein VEC35_09205 [Noviherbaspirillum sp.]|nr:hypothetical protein [Noviherbaspirillum sp.]
MRVKRPAPQGGGKRVKRAGEAAALELQSEVAQRLLRAPAGNAGEQVCCWFASAASHL